MSDQTPFPSELEPYTPGVAVVVGATKFFGFVAIMLCVVDDIIGMNLAPTGEAALTMTWASSLMLDRPAVLITGLKRTLIEYALPVLAIWLGITQGAAYGWINLNGVLSLAVITIGVTGVLRGRRWLREYPSVQRSK